MKLRHIFELIEEKKEKTYLMDRCLMWFLYRYKTLKWDIEDYQEMPTYFEPDDSGKVKKLLKETKQMSIETSFSNLIIELNSEMFIIETGITPDGEKFRVKNKEEDLNLRKALLEEVEKDKQEFDKRKIQGDPVKELIEENRFLRERVANRLKFTSLGRDANLRIQSLEKEKEALEEEKLKLSSNLNFATPVE